MAILISLPTRLFAYPGESALEKLEFTTFNFEYVTEKEETAPIKWQRPRVLDYITSTSRGTPDGFILPGPKRYGSPGCWAAAGKAICGEYDPKHHLLAFFHSGCCESNAVMYYPTTPSFEVPTGDLSDLRTATGIRIGSSAAEVVQKLGKPTIFHDKATNRVMYAYDYPPSGRSCEAHWIVFILQANRVVGIEDTAGC